jgi:hypothetical protein
MRADHDEVAALVGGAIENRMVMREADRQMVAIDDRRRQGAARTAVTLAPTALASAPPFAPFWPDPRCAGQHGGGACGGLRQIA